MILAHECKLNSKPGKNTKNAFIALSRGVLQTNGWLDPD